MHQLPDGIKDDLELRIILLFHGIQLPGQIGMGGQQMAQLDESPHDGDVDLDGPGVV